ncbi:MAG: thermonuclease family protein [Aeromicrobium erythreum]
MPLGRRALAAVLAVGVAVTGLGGCEATGPSESTSATAAPTPSTEAPAATPSSAPTPRRTLLQLADLKDGDSFVASDGQEYRLGLVNTPERDEPCARQATEFTRRFLRSGFTADAYSEDGYGRLVAEVKDPSGRSLNVALARSGLADDRYLEQFRSENPDLARRVDAAFDRAPRPSCREA